MKTCWLILQWSWCKYGSNNMQVILLPVIVWKWIMNKLRLNLVRLDIQTVSFLKLQSCKLPNAMEWTIVMIIPGAMKSVNVISLVGSFYEIDWSPVHLDLEENLILSMIFFFKNASGGLILSLQNLAWSYTLTFYKKYLCTTKH